MFARVRVGRVACVAQIQAGARDALVTEARQKRHLASCAMRSKMDHGLLALGFIKRFFLTGFSERTMGTGFAGDMSDVQLEHRLV